MQKRGIILLEVLVKLVPVILILLLFLAFAFIFLPSFFGGADQNTKNSFEATANAVDTFVSKNTKFETTELIITMPQGTLLKGYSSNALSEPVKCDGKACICYFDDYRNIVENRPVECEIFEETIFYSQIFFLTVPDPEKSYPGQQYALAYGLGWDPKVNIPPYPSPLDSWSYGNLFIEPSEKGGKVKFDTFYVEKYAVEDKVYILIARIVDGPVKQDFKDAYRIVDGGIGITEEQKKQRLEVLSLCPAGSEQQCISRYINSKVDGKTCLLTTQGICVLTDIPECTPEEAATERCLCGSKPLDPDNTCTKDKKGNYLNLRFSCTQVNSCNDYCKYGTALCEGETETNACALDSCNVGGCQVAEDRTCAART